MAEDIQDAIAVSRPLISLIYDPQTKHGESHTNLNSLREKLAATKNVPVQKLPPSEPAFVEHVKRAGHQCRIWMRAGETKPDIPSPEGNGWYRKDGILQPKFFEGPTSAEMMNDLVCSCRGSEPCTDNCTCANNNLPCTDECMCANNDRECGNAHPESDSDSDTD